VIVYLNDDTRTMYYVLYNDDELTTTAPFSPCVALVAMSC
jgi:hypothetical protein